MIGDRMPRAAKPALLPRQLPATPKQVLGPYFLPESPRRRKLFPDGAQGTRIKISGQVLTTDCQTLSGAMLHVWLADTNGRYANQDDEGNALVVPESKQLYRGRIKTDALGRYSFECLRPGNYFDTGWNLWRPAHIHAKVEANGFVELVTQLYFQDDAQNKSDIKGDDFFQPELSLQLSPAVARKGVTQKAFFNFVLLKA